MIRVLAIASLVVVILLSIIALQRKQISTLSKERKQAIEFASTEKSTSTFYKNKLDRETLRANVLDISLRNANDLITSNRLSFVKQFDGINKRLNNLESVNQTTVSIVKNWKLPLRDTIIIEPGVADPFEAKVFSYMDSLNSISGVLIGDEVRPQIEITVPLQGAMYWQRKKILWFRIGRKQWFSDITTTNPCAKIRSHEIIRISKRK